MATNEENKPEATLPKSKSPEEILNAANLFSLPQGQFFSPKMKYFEMRLLRKNVHNKITRAKWGLDRAFEAYPSSKKVELEAQFEELAGDFIMQCCGAEFFREHGEELSRIEGADDKLEFISSLFTEESQEEQIQRAKDQLDNMSRKVETSETFARFLKRISAVARLITDNKVNQDFLINEKFKKSISPANRSFLFDNLQWDESCETIANYLDSRRRHMKLNNSANIHKIEIESQINDLIENQSFLLAQQAKKFEQTVAATQAKAEEQNGQLLDQISILTAKISAMEGNQGRDFSPRSYAPRLPFQPTDQGQGRSRFSYQNQGQWRNPRSRFCRACNSDEHWRSECPKITCFVCGKSGHMAKACSERKISAEAKAEQSLN